MEFEPNEKYDVIVSYRYSLGGYPFLDYNAKDGSIEYYLTPAAMWNDFGSITINLKLDKDMPVISSSNLEFKKLSARTYRYTSDTLPKENLEIVIDENWWQNFFSSFKNPYKEKYRSYYLSTTNIMCTTFVLIIVIVGIFIILRLCKKKKHNM